MKTKITILSLLLLLSSGSAWATITLDPSGNHVLMVGESVSIIATCDPSTFTTMGFTVTSSNASVATVIDNTLVTFPQYRTRKTITAVGTGTATITFRTNMGSHLATCVVTVPTTIATLTTTNATVSLNVGYTASCDVTVTDPNVANDDIRSTVFAAYPNPASGIINLIGLTPGKMLHIYSITGSLVGTYTAQGEEMTINIVNLNKGMYFLTMEGKTIRIIKN